MSDFVFGRRADEDESEPVSFEFIPWPTHLLVTASVFFAVLSSDDSVVVASVVAGMYVLCASLFAVVTRLCMRPRRIPERHREGYRRRIHLGVGAFTVMCAPLSVAGVGRVVFHGDATAWFWVALFVEAVVAWFESVAVAMSGKKLVWPPRRPPPGAVDSFEVVVFAGPAASGVFAATLSGVVVFRFGAQSASSVELAVTTCAALLAAFVFLFAFALMRERVLVSVRSAAQWAPSDFVAFERIAGRGFVVLSVHFLVLLLFTVLLAVGYAASPSSNALKGSCSVFLGVFSIPVAVNLGIFSMTKARTVYACRWCGRGNVLREAAQRSSAARASV